MTTTTKSMTDPKAVPEIFRQAAELNRHDPLLTGCMLHFPDYGQVVMTGDMHGHRRNFDRLKKYADLDTARARHVMLHELIHAEAADFAAEDDSHEVFLEAAQWKVEHPDQVHFLHSNHEMSQCTGKEITKGGRLVNIEFEKGVLKAYRRNADDVLQSITEFIASFPLAARTPNRILLSHSLPNARDMGTFDPGVVHRPLRHADLIDGGDAYAMVWGRHHPPELIDTLAEAFDVDLFVCGHQPQEDGYEIVHDRLIIIASDHNHGVFLPFDLKKTYTIDTLARQIRRFAAVA